MIFGKNQTILISPVGGQAIYSIINYFKGKGFRVVGIDSRPEAIGKFFVDQFFEVPNVGDKSYADRILKIIDGNKINIFISWLDSEIIFWNEKYYASQIPRNLVNIFAFNFSRGILNHFDKFKFYSLLDNYGFNRPKTSLLSDEENIKFLNYPVIIKPRIGYGAKDTYVVEKIGTLEYYTGILRTKFSDLSTFLIQEFIDGIEYTIDFFSVKGKVINSVARKRIEHRGVSLKGEIVCDKAINKIVNDFCSLFNINGLNNVQLIQRGYEFYLIDFNPRPSGTIMFSINAGVDLMNNLLEMMYGGNITKYLKPKKLKMIRYLYEFYYE